MTNRALLLAAMAEGDSILEGCLDAEDTELMRTCLTQLGVRTQSMESNHESRSSIVDLKVSGRGPLLTSNLCHDANLYVGTAGTVARFLTAVLSALGVGVRVDGSPRMRERPMATLIAALREQGANIECLEQSGFLPVQLNRFSNDHAYRGGEIVLDRPASSQFVSALVLAALVADRRTRLNLLQGTPARPYVDMTLAMIRQFSGQANWVEDKVIEIEPGALQACRCHIEPDASAASYFLAMPCIYGGKIEIAGLGTQSVQGDAQFCGVLERMGAKVRQDSESTIVEGSGRLSGGDFDLSAMPDMTLTVAVLALFADSPTTIHGVEILRHHESDRLAAATTELRKLGAKVDERDDGLRIEAPVQGYRRGVEIDTYLDHRMAMAFSLVGDVVIRDPGCAAKTFPTYFDYLGQFGMIVPASDG